MTLQPEAVATDCPPRITIDRLVFLFVATKGGVAAESKYV
jgi:hypothetical protein